MRMCPSKIHLQMQENDQVSAICRQYTIDNIPEHNHWVTVSPPGTIIDIIILNCVCSLISGSVYALYKRNMVLGAILVAFNVALVGVGLWLYLEPSLQCQSRACVRLCFETDVTPVILLPGSLALNDSIPLHSASLHILLDSMQRLQISKQLVMRLHRPDCESNRRDLLTNTLSCVLIQFQE